MSLRIRQVKPDFWRDSIVSELSDTSRLVYIGLWMEADDAGWLRLNVTEISADLYPFSPRRQREHKVASAIEELVRFRRIEEYDCGHALLPNLTRHQRFAAMDKRVHTVQREHQSQCVEGLSRGDPRDTAETRTSPPRNVKEGEGKERNGGVSGGSAPRSMPIKINDDGRFEVAPVAAAGAER